MKWLRASHAKLRWPKIQVPTDTKLAPLYVRLVWMLGIWMASITVLALVAYVLRLAIVP